jgi:hypothetical protein
MKTFYQRLPRFNYLVPTKELPLTQEKTIKALKEKG